MATQTDSPAELQYYLYVDGDWRGPFHVAQIKELIKQRRVDLDTYAYEPQRQEQLTVRLLIKSGSSPRLTAIPPAPSGEESRQQEKLALALHALDEIRQASTTLSTLQGEPRQAECKRIGRAREMVTDAIQRHLDRPADLREIALKLQSVADDLGKGGDDRTLTVRVVRMSDSVGAADAAGIASAAALVLDRLVERAATHDDEHPFAAWDSEQTPTETVVATARHELKHLQSDLNAVKEAYEKLQETHAKEQQQARKLLALAKEQIEAEQKGREGDVAELRGLAGEIHSLAVSLGLAEIDAELATQIERLAKELEHAVPTAITPVAERVLNDLVGRLDLERRDLRQQLGELAQLRADLLQSKSEMSLLRQREEALVADKVKLHKLLEEARGATVRLDQHAKAREQQLKGTIAALQVTKDLHDEFMSELQEQLKGAQGKVEEMERELTTARRELKGTRANHEQREQELQAALTQLGIERQKLEHRRTSLQLSLQSAETELQQVKSRQGEGAEDESLTEALAAKVNQLRSQFEQTKMRLREQESSAGKLQEELVAARDEAEQLRLRSDGLTNELESARHNLDGARKRMEELHRAHARLEAEREALSKELNERKSTDSIHKPNDKNREERSHLQRVVEQLEARAAETALRADTLSGALDQQLARAEALDGQRIAAQSRIDELLAERSLLAAGGSVADARVAAVEARLAEAEKRHASARNDVRARDDETRGAAEDLRAQLASERTTLTGLRAELDAARSEVHQIGTTTQRRLDETQRLLGEAAQERTDIHARLLQNTAERDRLAADLGRLRTQHEAAAVEHRAALAMARQAQAEALARNADFSTTIEQLRLDLDGARVEAARAIAALGVVTDQHTTTRIEHQAQLAGANDRLAKQAELAQRLARELAERQGQAEGSAARTGQPDSMLQDRIARLESALEQNRQAVAALHSGPGTAANAAAKSALDHEGTSESGDVAGTASRGALVPIGRSAHRPADGGTGMHTAVFTGTLSRPRAAVVVGTASGRRQTLTFAKADGGTRVTAIVEAPSQPAASPATSTSVAATPGAVPGPAKRRIPALVLPLACLAAGLAAGAIAVSLLMPSPTTPVPPAAAPTQPSAPTSAPAASGTGVGFRSYKIEWRDDPLVSLRPVGDVAIQADRVFLRNGGQLAAAHARELNGVLSRAGDFSIECIVQPTSIDGPNQARILAIGTSPVARNFSLSQSASRLEVRLRTSATSPNGLRPCLVTADGVVTGAEQHLVYVRRGDQSILYVDGREAAHCQVPGDLSTWDAEAGLVVGNDPGGFASWGGSVSGLRLHTCALTADEIADRAHRRPKPEPAITEEPVRSAQAWRNPPAVLTLSLLWSTWRPLAADVAQHGGATVAARLLIQPTLAPWLAIVRHGTSAPSSSLDQAEIRR